MKVNPKLNPKLISIYEINPKSNTKLINQYTLQQKVFITTKKKMLQ